MKQGNISHWSEENKNSNLLIFTQLVNELLFDYSIPSNKISTLNSHYLCYDAMMTISTIENNGVPEGTLKPIAEELYDVLSKDIVFKKVKEEPLKFFIKKTSERYREAKPSELNYQELKLIIYAIHNKFFKDDWYLTTLKKEIANCVKSNESGLWKDLFKLTKIYLTELVNGGYDSRYIYEMLHYLFFSTHTCSDEITIDKFLDAFNFSECEYTVFIKCPSSLKKILTFIKKFKPIKDGDITANTKKGKAFINTSSNEIIYSTTTKAYDKYSAVNSIKGAIELISAQYKLYDHNIIVNSELFAYAISSNASDIFIIESPKGAVLKKGTLPKERLTKKMQDWQDILQKRSKENGIYDLHTINKALVLHSHSLESDSEENQLLDLWSIFETVLDISNKHTSDRIQQVCFLLIPILKRKYIYSLFEQLANDIYLYSKDLYKEITEYEQVNETGIEKLCCFILVDSYEQKRKDILKKIVDFPLLKERIFYYNEVLSTKGGCTKFIEKHLNRIRWQIMRIYRNRNLIIHNGERMPYLSLLIENLHYYVDDFIEYIFEALLKGLSLYNMELDLFIEEHDWMKHFSSSNDKIQSKDISFLLNY